MSPPGNPAYAGRHGYMQDNVPADLPVGVASARQSEAAADALSEMECCKTRRYPRMNNDTALDGQETTKILRAVHIPATQCARLFVTELDFPYLHKLSFAVDCCQSLLQVYDLEGRKE